MKKLRNAKVETQTPGKSRESERHTLQTFTKLQHLKEMGNFIDIYHLPNLNQDQISHLNRPVNSKDVEQ